MLVFTLEKVLLISPTLEFALAADFAQCLLNFIEESKSTLKSFSSFTLVSG